MRTEVKELQEKLKDKRPEKWERIPDIDLYMDQISAYMTRQHIGLADDEEETLTSAMINNYIKSGVLPRANGKKYNKDHIVYLTAICLLKQIVSVSDTGSLIASLMEHQTSEEFYEKYSDTEEREFGSVASRLEDVESDEDIAEMALKLAVSSYAQKYACKKLVDMLKGVGEESKGSGSKKEKERSD